MKEMRRGKKEKAWKKESGEGLERRAARREVEEKWKGKGQEIKMGEHRWNEER